MRQPVLQVRTPIRSPHVGCWTQAFSELDAQVVCRELGLYGGNAILGLGEGPRCV